MRLKRVGPNFEEVMVSRVVRGSPAEHVGIEPDDRLPRINGEEAGKLGLEKVRVLS